MENRRQGSAIGGIVLVIVGALYLVANLLGQSFGSIAQFIGPVITIALGAYFMYRIYGPDRKPGKVAFPWPLFMIFGGLFALAAMTGFWSYGISMGPVALIIVGVWLLIKRTR